MNSSHARILLLVGLAGGLASCHDTSTSADTMYGPENVLQAPLLSKDNVQFNKKNRELHEAALADSMYFVKKSREHTAASTDTNSAAAHDTTGAVDKVSSGTGPASEAQSAPAH